HALEAELGGELVEALTMQHVELDPRAPSAPHLVHGRLIHAAPAIGEVHPVHVVETMRLAEVLPFARDARAPVHDGAKDVEGERLDRSRIEVSHGLVSVSRARGVSSATAAPSRMRPRPGGRSDRRIGAPRSAAPRAVPPWCGPPEWSRRAGR